MVIIAIIIKAKISYLVMMEGIMVIIVQTFVPNCFVMVVGIMEIMVIGLSLIVHFPLVID
jgi:hypothetical protein